MGICAPWFTGYVDRPRFSAMEQTGRGLRTCGQVKVLPMTLPDQRTRYRSADEKDEQVDAFEEALAGWLGPFFGTGDGVSPRSPTAVPRPLPDGAFASSCLKSFPSGGLLPRIP